MVDPERVESNWRQLHQLLTDHFNLDELRTLCFEFRIDFENLPGETKGAKARELILLVDRHNRLNELLHALNQKRPSVTWPDIFLPQPEEQLYSTGTKHQKIQDIHDAAIGELFTDQSAHLDVLKKMVDTEKPKRRTVWIFGVGGIGKSWLLRKFRLICVEQGITVASVSGDEEKTVLDVLTTLGRELGSQGIELRTFNEQLGRYWQIQTEVLQKVNLEGYGSKFTENVLSRDEIDLYMNYAQRLTNLFLKDLAEVVSNGRIVLMFDTFEQMIGLEAWMRRFVEQLSAGVLVVIAGRTPPLSSWRNLWPIVETVELKEMAPEDAKEYVGKHYHYLRRNLDEAETELDETIMEQLEQFGRGLPLALSSSVHLIAQYGASEFSTRRNEVVADLIDVMTREAGEEWRLILETCAVVRWFTRDTLGVMLNMNDSTSLYRELQKFPFVLHSRQGRGLALHDRMSEWMRENLKTDAPGRWQELNERAIDFYEDRLSQLESAGRKYGEEWQRCVIEKVYHQIKVGDEVGLAALREAFEEAQLYYPQSMSTLLQDANADSRFGQRKGNWLRYYESRLYDDLNKRISELGNLVYYPELELYARTSLGIALFDMQQVEQAIEELEKNLKYVESSKYAEIDTVAQAMARMSCRRLGTMYRIVGRQEDADRILSQVKGADARVLMERGRTCLFIGKYEEAVGLYKRSLRLLEDLSGPRRYAIMAWRQLGHVYMNQGRLEEARTSFLRSLIMGEDIDDQFDIDAAQSNLAILDRDTDVLAKSVERMNQPNLHKGKVSIVCWYLAELGHLYLSEEEYSKAEKTFTQVGKLSEKAKYHHGALQSVLGLCYWNYQVKGTVSAELIDEAERLLRARWDQHARLRLLQGHQLVDFYLNVKSDQKKTELQEKISYKYFEAMKCAVKHNRYTLDRVVEQIIIRCLPLEHDGLETLRLLGMRWENGELDGKCLLELEEEGRKREKGDGKRQVSVLERLESAVRETGLNRPL